MRIGELAARAGVNVQTVRYYERRGLLAEPRRRTAGYRDYSNEALGELCTIRRLKELGYTLDEIRTLVRIHRQGTGPNGAACDLAARKIRELDEKIRHLQETRDALEVERERCGCAARRPAT
jgi:MerR family mercuric resistance operon transcriptional regulator